MGRDRPSREGEGGTPEPAEGGRMRTPAVCCPRCGSRPALRVSEALIESLQGLPPGWRIASYQCQRRGCGTIYEVPARACQNAR